MTGRRVAGILAGMVLPLLVVSSVGTSGHAAPPEPWTAPAVIPGTAGQANPLAATAPDGTDLLVWMTPGPMSPQNVLNGKVRLPGRSAWLPLPTTLVGDYLGVAAMAGTPDGDFWILLGDGSVNYRTRIVRLHTRTQAWTRPVTLFGTQTDNAHTPTGLGLAGDGTLVVTASAPPLVPAMGDPAYRLAVTVKKPGGRWASRFVSPLGKMTTNHTLSVNKAGDILISFIQGYNLADMKVRAAFLPHGSRVWKVSDISAAGQSQRTRSSLAPDGTAAVVWVSPASAPFSAAHLATRNVRRSTAPWVGRDLATGGNLDVDSYVVAGRKGRATAFWRTVAGGSVLVWSRHFDGSALAPAVQVTATGEIAEFNAVRPRPDGTALLVYQRFTPAIHGIASEARVLTNGVASAPETLIGDETTFGATNGEQVTVDAAGRGLMVYTQGTYPATTFTWLGQAGPPAVMTSPTSGVAVTRAKVTGRTSAGSVMTCATGYWVDASRRTYRWTRNGLTIRGAIHPSYRLVSADRGKRIACQVVATNATGSDLTLTSPARKVSG